MEQIGEQHCLSSIAHWTNQLFINLSLACLIIMHEFATLWHVVLWTCNHKEKAVSEKTLLAVLFNITSSNLHHHVLYVCVCVCVRKVSRAGAGEPQDGGQLPCILAVWGVQVCPGLLPQGAQLHAGLWLCGGPLLPGLLWSHAAAAGQRY